ncbi:hypothetical protein C8R43DRAFT_121683 [Mycena crocata]|nr:hypothetical protein C8R43DRAFT_121683 [Mycena crocata]
MKFTTNILLSTVIAALSLQSVSSLRLSQTARAPNASSTSKMLTAAVRIASGLGTSTPHARATASSLAASIACRSQEAYSRGRTATFTRNVGKIPNLSERIGSDRRFGWDWNRFEATGRVASNQYQDKSPRS